MTDESVLLDSMSRPELIAKAKSLGIERPQVMTRVELKDAILRRTARDDDTLREARGWFGVARDLVASVVERGLHLPDAAGVLRGTPVRMASWAPPVATVTLAEIYASQGHRDRAVVMLDEVLRREPEHEVARQLRDRLALGAARSVDASSMELLDRAAADGTVGPVTSEEAVTGSTESALGASSGCTAGVPTAPVSAASKEMAAAMASEAGDSPASEVRRMSEEAGDESVEPAARSAPVSSVPRVSVESFVPRLDVLFWRRSGDGVVALYWELSPESERRHLEHDPEGKPVSRLAGAYVERGSCCRFEREVELSGSFGSTRVGSVPSGAQLRVALGWTAAGRFVPIALGLAIERGAGAGEWWEHLVAEPAQQEELGRARQRAAASIG